MRKKDAMKWVNALRSGKYKQGEPLFLKSDTGYCCLGVLCEINNYKFTKDDDKPFRTSSLTTFVLPFELTKKLNMSSPSGNFRDNTASLSLLNDIGIVLDNGKWERLTFDELADIIQICYKEL